MRQLCLLAATAVLSLVLGPVAWSRIPAKVFGQYWGHQWNALARSEKSPWQITVISCKPDGEAIYLCYAILQDAQRRTICRNLAVANNGVIVLPPRTVPCLPVA